MTDKKIQMAKLTDDLIATLWHAAQDQAVSGIPAPVHFARALLAQAAPVIVAAVGEIDDFAAPAAPVAAAVPAEEGLRMSDLLAAPQLYAQVYIAARCIRQWPNDAAMDAADSAVETYGGAPCGNVETLREILDEVLRVDGEAAPAPVDGDAA